MKFMNFHFYYFIYNPAEKFEIEYRGMNNKKYNFPLLEMI